jgi:hypothetical protein
MTPETGHLGSSERLEEDVVLRSGPGHRAPLLEQGTEVVIRVTEHLGKRGLGREPRLGQLAQASEPDGRPGLGDRRAVGVCGVEREAVRSARAASGALAEAVGNRRAGREGAQRRVEEFTPSGGEKSLRRVEEVDPEVDEERDPMRERDPRSPQDRRSSQRLPELVEGGDERPTVGPQGMRVAEHDEVERSYRLRLGGERSVDERDPLGHADRGHRRSQDLRREDRERKLELFVRVAEEEPTGSRWARLRSDL